ncbi:MAG: transporter substrate-binding domain-containing protein [Streptococcaceae bacterium]|jgi:polar amino acid transport system substrate-binding protein|nr:transporter substrate-binding domain-containing protein [Streptococcaceae bacterium]
MKHSFKLTVKRFLGVAAVVSAALVLAACSSGAKKSTNQTTINIGTDGATKPFDYSENGKLTGYDIEVTRAVFAKLPEYKLNFTIMDFNSITQSLDNGRIQLAANDFGWTAARAEKYAYSSPLSLSNNAIAVASSSTIKASKLSDLAGKTTEGMPASNYTTSIKAYNATVSADKQIKMNFVSGQTPFSNRLNDVATGKIDFVLYDRISLESTIKDMGFASKVKVQNVTTTSGDPEHDGYEYLLFAKTSEGTTLQTKVNKVLKELQADGTLKKLSEKYLGGDFVPKAEMFK